jgi:MFS family permease
VSTWRTNRWLVLLVVSSALFLIVIDMSVLHTALPTLTRELGASAAEKLWIINAYALVVAGLLRLRHAGGPRGSPAHVRRRPRRIQSVHQALDAAYLIALSVNAVLLAAVAVIAWRARSAPHDAPQV